jgi:iron complex transport system substrate-binding protein
MDILNGYNDGTYRPGLPQSREMAFSVLARALNLRAQDPDAYKAFADYEQVSEWAGGDMSAMIEAGHVNGSGGKLLPQDGLKRAEAAKIFVVIYAGDQENRVVCLAPSMVEVVYALGFGDDIVGWSQYTDYPIEVADREGWIPYGDYEFISIEDELSKDVAVVSGFTDYNAELVALLKPTLILAESSMQYPMYEELLAKGYNVLFHDPASVDEIYEMMINIGEALGAGDTAKTLVEGYNREIEEIKAITSRLPKLDVYYEIGHRMTSGEYSYGPYTAGSGTPFDDMVEIAGGKNVFDHLEGGYTEISYKDIVAADPDIILSPMWPNAFDYEVTTVYEIVTREGFSDIKAVQNSRVLFYDSSLMKRYGPRTVTAIKKLAYLLHPYYFENPKNAVSPWELGKIDEFYPIPAPLR